MTTTGSRTLRKPRAYSLTSVSCARIPAREGEGDVIGAVQLSADMSVGSPDINITVKKIDETLIIS